MQMKDQIRSWARTMVPSSAKGTVRQLFDITIPSDLESYRQLRLAKRSSADTETGSVSVRQLGGARILIRPGTRDPACAHYTFVDQFHVPPGNFSLPPNPVIWDLGANIGLTMAHLAFRFPCARIWGIELDAANAELARQNVRPWTDRCTVLTGAVWSVTVSSTIRGTRSMRTPTR